MSASATANSLEDWTAEVVTTAVIRAADRLGLNNKELAKIIGASEATVSRLRGGTYRLQRSKKEFELSLLVARPYRSLDAIVGGEDSVARQWIRNENTALRAKPIELLQEVVGLTDVIRYLDSRRAPV